MTEKNLKNVTTTNLTCQTFPWDQITAPGTYVCNWSGHLLRIPTDGISGTTPQINIVGAEPLYVTKISNDPFLCISQARLTASNLDINVNF